MSVFPSQDTFVRGELSPRLHARASLDLYKAGLSKCENFLTLPHGGMRKRGGTYFVDEVSNSARQHHLVGFVFSSDQAYALVLGHYNLRIYAYGARVGTVHLTTPWPETDVERVQFEQSGDVMWFTHHDYQTQQLIRNSHTDWELQVFETTDGPFDPPNIDDTVTLYVSGASGSITIHSNENLFSSDMIGRLARVDIDSYTDIQPWEPNVLVDMPTIGIKRRYNGNVYECVSDLPDSDHSDITAFDVYTGTTPPTHTRGVEWDGWRSYQVNPNGSTVVKDILRGLQWRYLHSGFGIARITGFTSATQVDAEVLTMFPEGVIGAPNASPQWRLGVYTSDSYPETVSIFEERLVFGNRFSISGSKTADFKHFETGERGDDGLSFTQAGGGSANDIVWLKEMDGFLAIGTIGGVRSLSGAGIDEALTPTSFKNRSSRTTPCEPLRPVSAGSAFVYVGKGRRKLVGLALNAQLRFESEDLGQISEHIPKRGVKCLAFQEHPDPLLWFPLDTGEIGCFTYQPAQEVRGMHRHLIGGSAVVESACVTPGQEGQDDVWLIVRRTINGQTRRYIEILTPSFEYGSVSDAFQVDCGLSRSGSAVNAVTGLSHLAGQTVDVLADGVVYRGRAVSNTGGVTLPAGKTASKWHVGLPFEAEATTLELDVGGKDGSLLGRRKRVNKVILSLLETDISGLEITSMQRERWEKVKLPSIVGPADAVKLYTGNVDVPIDDSWEGQGRVRIRHTNPTPCTVRAMTPVFDSEP